MSISQSEFDYLIRQKKAFDNYETIDLGPAPIQWKRQINSIETKETFILDFYRGSFELTRFTYNKRYRQTIILIRYDSKGRHTNPDGKLFDGPHVHIYQEGYNDKFAFPVSEIGVKDGDSMETILQKMLTFCNVQQLPTINFSMF